MAKLRSGSVIRTKDDAIWYACGDWHTKDAPLDTYPGILGYLPTENVSPRVEKIKTIVSGGKTYIKAFGQSLEVYRDNFLSRETNVYSPQPIFGKVVFIKKSQIVEIRDPVNYVPVFLEKMNKVRKRFQTLLQILDLPLSQVGISGSALAIGTPVWRHEIDIVVYGTQQSREAYNHIQEGRKDGTFSQKSLQPFHLPFRYRNIWFDPQFSEDDHEENWINGCSIHKVTSLEDKILEIADDKDSIFFPASYLCSDGKRLISFRSSHRGLFRPGRSARFASLSLIFLEYPNKETETAYGVLEHEWGTPL